MTAKNTMENEWMKHSQMHTINQVRCYHIFCKNLLFSLFLSSALVHYYYISFFYICDAYRCLSFLWRCLCQKFVLSLIVNKHETALCGQISIDFMRLNVYKVVIYRNEFSYADFCRIGFHARKRNDQIFSICFLFCYLSTKTNTTCFILLFIQFLIFYLSENLNRCWINDVLITKLSMRRTSAHFFNLPFLHASIKYNPVQIFVFDLNFW